ncbi:hypothetical protein SEA_CECE_318 [Microbacterium phage Cece]|nr:hypothetical protein SEA_CECE_16 [Microbacterium phage Cece]UVG35324.1 hypothetical protein SEA_CECE_318 [Microbacterium phage Cece]
MATNEPIHVSNAQVSLVWECWEEDDHESGDNVKVVQPIADLPESGTPVCPECDSDALVLLGAEVTL